MTVEHYYNAGWRDITDYVEQIDRVPRTFRNRDYTLKAESINLTIAVTIENDANYVIGFKFSEDEKVRVKDKAGVVIWTGLISKSIYDPRPRQFSVNVKNLLQNLRNTLIDYDNLHTAFATGAASQYWTDYLSAHSVQVLWAMEKVFADAGITLDVPAGLKTTALFTRSASGVWDGRAITFADLYFDEDQLWCLGKSFALVHAGTVSAYRSAFDDSSWKSVRKESYIVKIVENKATVDGFDFISECLTSLKLDLVANSGATEGYQLVYNTGNYTVANDDRYEAIEEKTSVEKTDIGYRWVTLNASGNWLASNSNRSKFVDTTQNDLSELSTSDNSSIQIMPNFAIYFADTTNFSGDYGESVCEPTLSANLIIDDSGVTGHLNVIAARYKDQATARTFNKIKTDYLTAFEGIEEHTADEWDDSEIIQE